MPQPLLQHRRRPMLLKPSARTHLLYAEAACQQNHRRFVVEYVSQWHHGHTWSKQRGSGARRCKSQHLSWCMGIEVALGAPHDGVATNTSLPAQSTITQQPSSP